MDSLKVDDLWALEVFRKAEFASNLGFDAFSNIVYLLFTQKFNLHDTFSWKQKAKNDCSPRIGMTQLWNG